MLFTCIGAQGVGKSVTLYRLRERGYFATDGIVRPLIRFGIHKVLSKEDYQRLINELTILHHTAFLNVNHPFFFTRSILDCIAYGRADGLDRHGSWAKEGIEWYEKNRDKYVYMYFPIEFPLEGDSEREQDSEYQRRVDRECLNILEETNTFFYTINGSIEKRVGEIIKIIQKEGF